MTVRREMTAVWYRAPELLMGAFYSKVKARIWR